MQLYIRPTANHTVDALPRNCKQGTVLVVQQAHTAVTGFAAITDVAEEQEIAALEGRVAPISGPHGLPPCHKDYPGSPKPCNGFCGHKSCKRWYDSLHRHTFSSPAYSPYSPPPVTPSPSPSPTENTRLYAGNVNQLDVKRAQASPVDRSAQEPLYYGDIRFRGCSPATDEEVPSPSVEQCQMNTEESGRCSSDSLDSIPSPMPSCLVDNRKRSTCSPHDANRKRVRFM